MKFLLTILFFFIALFGKAQFIFGNKTDVGQVTVWNVGAGVNYQGNHYYNPDGNILHDWRSAVAILNTDNVTIKGNYFSKTEFTHLEIRNCTNVVIEDNFFANGGTSIKIVGCTTVVIRNNKFINAHGNPAESVKGGNFIQTDQSANIQIYNNAGFAAISEANTEDLFSILGGCTNVEIWNNELYGQGSNSGGAVSIQTGDVYGTYIYTHRNIIIDPPGAGVSISGGEHNRISKNKVFARNSPVATTGIYIADYSIGNCADNTIDSNVVRVVRKSGGFSESYGYHDMGDCGTVAGVATNMWGAPADSFIVKSIPSLLGIDEDTMWQLREESNYYADWYYVERPTANAGSDQSISTTTATLNGSGGSTYSWVKVSGPGCTISSPSSSSTNITGLSNGTYKFRLVATDSDGEQDADWVTITVSDVDPPDPPDPPVGGNRKIKLKKI